MSSDDDLERLLAAERGREPPSGAAEAGLERLHSALAAGTPALVVAESLQTLGATTTAKWLVVSGSALVLAGSGTWALSARSPDPAAVVTSSASATFPPARAVSGPSAVSAPSASASGARLAVASSEPSAAHTVPRGVVAATPSLAPSASTRRAATTFDEELRLIRLAKADLDARRPHLAEVWLAEHASRFPNGVFAEERKALAILIGCESDPAGTRARAQAFMKSHRDSPLVDRVARACGLGLDSTGALRADGGAPEQNFPNGSTPLEETNR